MPDEYTFKDVGPAMWEIPKEGEMRVPARVVAIKELLPALQQDRSLKQLCNVATLPGIRGAALVMPDAHEGYGFPIGGVAATSYPDGCISPGGIGYDINCGVRLISVPLSHSDIKNKLKDLAEEMYRQVPTGLGKGSPIHLNAGQMNKVLTQGAKWAVEQKMGLPGDLHRIESGGCLKEADPSEVSDKAKDRGKHQIGSIGSGNHFAEIDTVHEIFDEKIAKLFGLHQDQVVVLIHTGSRGLGHQTATEYIRTMISVMPDYKIDLPDRELACVPFSSPEGQSYFKAMCAAANFAWCNRQVITWEMRKVFENLFNIDPVDIHVVYDVAHNIAKIETYEINGTPEKLIVHRKGATRAFGPGREELPEEFSESGQPVLIPGSMGTSSFVLAGQKGTDTLSFGSCCHGAGRRLSRTAAKKQVNAPGLIRELESKGIFVRAGSYRGVAEEAPIAYKDVDMVVESVQVAGLAKRVARLKPCAVIKG